MGITDETASLLLEANDEDITMSGTGVCSVVDLEDGVEVTVDAEGPHVKFFAGEGALKVGMFSWCLTMEVASDIMSLSAKTDTFGAVIITVLMFCFFFPKWS